MENIILCDALDCNEETSFKENPLVPLVCGHNLCLKAGLNMIKD
jgi:hypothetical protein